MPNTDAPNGFKPIRHVSGGTVRQNEYQIASGYAANIFSGNAVILTAAGVVENAAAGSIDIIGVFAGCSWVDTDGTQRFGRYWPTGTTAKTGTLPVAYVHDDPMQAFECQVTGVLTQAMVGTNCDILATAGSTSTGSSKHEVDITSPAATTAQVKILRLIDRADNALGQDAKIECMFEEHLLRTTVGV